MSLTGCATLSPSRPGRVGAGSDGEGKLVWRKDAAVALGFKSEISNLKSRAICVHPRSSVFERIRIGSMLRVWPENNCSAPTNPNSLSLCVSALRSHMPEAGS